MITLEHEYLDLAGPGQLQAERLPRRRGHAVPGGPGVELQEQRPAFHFGVPGQTAAAAQNPVAAMYSLPFQNNIYGGVGPQHDATANVLNIQPVIPITVGDWNIISRTIAPLIYQPSLATLPSESFELGPFGSSHFGLGDINQSFYFSPAKATEVIWGIGPSFNLPTATASALGSGKFSMGPAAVALIEPKPWVIGTLGRQLWSVGGPPLVSQLLLQPFVNYNMEDGWYLVSSPIITANWEAHRTNGLFQSVAVSARFSGSVTSR